MLCPPSHAEEQSDEASVLFGTIRALPWDAIPLRSRQARNDTRSSRFPVMLRTKRREHHMYNGQQQCCFFYMY
jgi:hypothetical protein